MTLFSIVGVVFFLITFLTTTERIIPKPEQRSSVLQDIKDLLGNKPWIIMLLVTVLVFVTLALKGGSYVYYFEYFVSETHLATFLEDSGFNGAILGLNNMLTSAGFTEFHWPEDTAISGLSVFNGIGIIFMIVGIGFSKFFADKYGKRNTYGVSLLISTVFVLVFYFFSSESIGLMFASQLLHGFSYGISIPILWAMIADVADYSEWKNNHRATAIIFAAMLFGLKFGLTIGGSLVAAILAANSYDPQAITQTPEAINGIKLSISLYSSLPFLIAVACLFFYEINKKMETQIEQDLKQRRVSD